MRTDFISGIYGRMEIAEIDVFQPEEEPSKKQARVVFEIEVTDGK